MHARHTTELYPSPQDFTDIDFKNRQNYLGLRNPKVMEVGIWMPVWIWARASWVSTSVKAQNLKCMLEKNANSISVKCQRVSGSGLQRNKEKSKEMLVSDNSKTLAPLKWDLHKNNHCDKIDIESQCKKVD